MERERGVVHGAAIAYVREIYLLAPARGVRAGGWSIQLTGGEHAVELHVEFADLKSLRRVADDVMDLVSSVRFTSREELAEGRPRLTRFMLDEAVALFEWLLQSPFTQAQAASLEVVLRRAWESRDRAEISALRDLLRTRASLRAMPAVARESLRGALLEAMLARWLAQRDASPLATAMLRIAESSWGMLVPGEPQLTGAAVGAFVEFACFAAQQVAETVTPMPSAIAEQLRDATIADWANLAPEQRHLIAHMPRLWAALRWRWGRLTPAERAECVAHWRATPRIERLAATLCSSDLVGAGRRAISDLHRLPFETAHIRAAACIVGGDSAMPGRW